MKSVIEYLKSGESVGVSLKNKSYKLLFVPENKLKSTDSFSYESAYALCTQVGQLYGYVQKIPELSWDLLEFAERPIAIAFEHWKEGSPLRAARYSFLLYYPDWNTMKIQNYFLFKLNEIPAGLSTDGIVLNLQINEITDFLPYRWMSLKMNGEVKIYGTANANELI